MQKSRIVITLAVFMSVAALTSSAQDGDQYIKVDIRGTIKTRIASPGGETTGTIITVKQKDTLDVTWQLDLGGKAEFINLARELDGKTALVTGTYFEKKGVVIKERHIVKVTSLKAPPGE